jgi:uncharacterized protein YfaT (DUF1175 family)
VESLAPAMTLVNPITGELTTLTAQQQQYITQATVTALSLTSDTLAQRTLSQNLDSNRSQNVPIFHNGMKTHPSVYGHKFLFHILVFHTDLATAGDNRLRCITVSVSSSNILKPPSSPCKLFNFLREDEDVSRFQ